MPVPNCGLCTGWSHLRGCHPPWRKGKGKVRSFGTAPGTCKTSPPCFVAECRKRRQIKCSLFRSVFFVVRVYWFVAICVFVLYLHHFKLLIGIRQAIGSEKRLQNDLDCVGWGIVKFCSPTYPELCLFLCRKTSYITECFFATVF